MVDFAKALIDRDADIRAAKVCPYCGGAPEKVDSSEIYGKSYGPIMLCRPCRAWVGFHKDGRVLGRLANAELREAKKAAHASFDELWRRKIAKGFTKPIARALAYKWLSESMGTPPEHTHIGMFDAEQCGRVVELCKPYLKKP